MLQGGCHCGAVRYEVTGTPVYRALCHCHDCRRHSGAPAVAWAALPEAALRVTGEVAEYRSSAQGRRRFCPACGTGLFYANAGTLPGLVDVQVATLDDPEAMAPEVRIQVADRPDWVRTAHTLPEFARYPPG